MVFKRPERIPVSILTGFLGSGKTTLLNEILMNEQEERIAVIVNEFGKTGIDHQLVISSEEDIYELNNGCLCCKVRTDLINTLYALIQAVEEGGHTPFDRVLIETTGLAEPAPIAQSFFFDPELSEIYHLDTIITVIDCYHFPKQMHEHEEVLKQAAFADHFILNKTDLVSEEDVKKVSNRLLAVNPGAQIQSGSHGSVVIKDLLNKFSFDLHEKRLIEPSELNSHHLDPDITAIVLTSENDMDMTAFEKWFGRIIDEKGEQMYRYKGIISAAGFEKRIVFQGVHMLFAGKAGSPWKTRGSRKSEFVIIGKDLDYEWFQSQFKTCEKSK
ncbi:CobW family GTP-binding protein [Alteribacter keqinensis]|uniref:GTP-binding protein n=1 Tax=Alteribacter keqinensis TaxID=2483800 RepID=A0A3M7TXG0_9BACI|nr:GTP-binding protein [Alteribacter keqinensis]RNA69959.1 GTP-binding protein [Alteribacter keqinensis]